MSKQKQIPEPLQADTIVAKLVKDQIYDPVVNENDWRMFVVVGREGSGKSLTCASILKACDPGFTVDHTHFDPIEFLEDVGQEMDRPGRASMGDEVGVAFGSRTWHDREQIEANQALQTARDYNRIIGLTLPRLEELDSQLQGRIHLLLETTRKKDGEWVEVKWKENDPSRSGQGKIYRKYPRKMIDGRKHRIERVKIGPPPGDYVDRYEEKKRQWKRGLFDRVVKRYEDAREDAVGGADPIEIAEEIIEEGVEEYIGESPAGEYLDRDLIELDYGIGENKSKKVKKYIIRKEDLDVM